MMLELWPHLFLSALFFLKDGPVLAHELTIAGQTIQDTITSSSKQQTPQQQLQSMSLSGSVFTLKVLVNELLSGQQLNKASVEVYVNYTRTDAALTGEDGVVLLHLPYQRGLPLTIVASKDGYILTPLPWETTKMPIFSSVTLSLYSLSQGNIWLFEDSVLITDRTSGVVLPPSVQFPKRLLNLSDGDIISSVRAYLTVPKPSTGRDGYMHTRGLLTSRFGYSSVELSPVAAVSAQLFSREREILVSGLIQISLPLPGNSGLKSADAVPAWLFDRNTGAWMNAGLGVVAMVEGQMMWTFNASHLGYWIAAPLPSTRGYIGLAVPIDFISDHIYFLMAIVGGTLVLLIGVLAVLSCCRRVSLSQAEAKRIRSANAAASTTDRTTSTCDDQLCEVSSSRDSLRPEDGSTQSVAGGTFDGKGDSPVSRRHNGNFYIYVDDSVLSRVRSLGNPVDAESEYSEASRRCPLGASAAAGRELLDSHGGSGLMRVPLSVEEGVFFQDGLVHLCHRPLAALHVAGLFHAREQPPRSKSATATPPNSPQPEAVTKDGFTQTLPKDSPLSQHPGPGGEAQGPSSSNLTWGHYSGLAESVSVPGTLNNTSDRGPHAAGPFCSELQGNSEQALAELSKLSRGQAPSLQPPRAWFVSLEGKPAAEIHRCSFTDPQRRRGPADSRDISLDSGVDMSEPSQQANRRPLQLERDGTFVKSPPQDKPLPREEAGPSRRDHAQGTLLETRGDSGTVSNFTKDNGELSGNNESRGTSASGSHVQAEGT